MHYTNQGGILKNKILCLEIIKYMVQNNEIVKNNFENKKIYISTQIIDQFNKFYQHAKK